MREAEGSRAFWTILLRGAGRGCPCRSGHRSTPGSRCRGSVRFPQLPPHCSLGASVCVQCPGGTRPWAMRALGREGEVELLWQWLICERGWLVHVSLGSLVYFFKAGVCFLISKALLCSFPNKVLKILLSPIRHSSALPALSGGGNMSHPAPPSPGAMGTLCWGAGSAQGAGSARSCSQPSVSCSLGAGITGAAPGRGR